MTKQLYFSTKKLGPISVAHRQWRSASHCSWVHGYGRTLQFVMACDQLDERQWVYDFSDFKDIRRWLEQQWDHKLLLASDDPLLETFLELESKNGISLNVMDVNKGWGPGIEGSCKFLADHVSVYIKDKTQNRVWLHSVEIWEHDGNSAKIELSNPRDSIVLQASFIQPIKLRKTCAVTEQIKTQV